MPNSIPRTDFSRGQRLRLNIGFGLVLGMLGLIITMHFIVMVLMVVLAIGKMQT